MHVGSQHDSRQCWAEPQTLSSTLSSTRHRSECGCLGTGQEQEVLLILAAEFSLQPPMQIISFFICQLLCSSVVVWLQSYQLCVNRMVWLHFQTGLSWPGTHGLTLPLPSSARVKGLCHRALSLVLLWDEADLDEYLLSWTLNSDSFEVGYIASKIYSEVYFWKI